MTTLGLTPRQKETFDFIKAEIETKGVAPSYRAIQRAIGLKSTSSVYRLLERLKARGLVTTQYHVAHSLALVDTPESRDAARYRYIRNRIDLLRKDSFIFDLNFEGLDQAIDEAIEQERADGRV